VRIAIVDIGTNSTRLMVGQVDSGVILEELERLTTITRLGAGVDATGRLDPEAIQRVYDALERYSERIEAHRTTEAHAVLTSAVRDASNGGAFARDVADRFHLTTHVLDGEREALLTYRGAISGRHDRATGGAGGEAGPGLMLVIDIGGGSTELVLGDLRTIAFHVSTDAGVVRQSERHIKGDPPSDAELHAVAEDVHATLDAAVPPALRTQVAVAIAVAGTPTSLAAIAQRLEPYDPHRTHGYRLTAAERDSIYRRLAAMTLEQRQAVPGLQPGRASVIVPGIVILMEVMRLFSLEFVEVSEHDILHGAMLAVADGKL
jgi:exopolyphosphatase/guanosine-5'-triphosphate,3'-diphosphate pyrophosphatase